jgi:hypothetical protein
MASSFSATADPWRLSGRLVEPVLILGLQVNERLDGIAPALRPAVVNAWLLFLAALTETALSLCVAKPYVVTQICYVTACQRPNALGSGPIKGYP